MADIKSHLGDGGLSVAEVARREGLSPRYVQKLFETTRFTFSSFVREQRLMHAHRLLSDPEVAHGRIAAIAFDVGFGDLSYFNRAFRQRYGTTPGEIRRPALRAARQRRTCRRQIGQG